MSYKVIRLIVAGGRDTTITEEGYEALDMIVRDYDDVAIITGGAEGVDRAANLWAENRGHNTIQCNANWTLHGRSAGPIRNRFMASIADSVALFPGGKGTASMRREAQLEGLKVYDIK